MKFSTTEIAPDVHCVGPKGHTRTNVYLVSAGSSWTLIDAGWVKDATIIQAAADQVFGAGARPTAIVLTHVHPDHSGSALELARAWDCPVLVHPNELAIATGNAAAIRAGGGPLDTWLILPLLRLFGERRRDEILAQGKLAGFARALDPGSQPPSLPGWHCVPTPGHTPGHASFYRASDRVLISGDALVTLRLNSIVGLLLGRPGLSGPPWYTSWSWHEAKASVAALARLQPLVVAGGHGRPMRGADTPATVNAFAERFARPAIPNGPA